MHPIYRFNWTDRSPDGSSSQHTPIAVSTSSPILGCVQPLQFPLHTAVNILVDGSLHTCASTNVGQSPQSRYAKSKASAFATLIDIASPLINHLLTTDPESDHFSPSLLLLP